MGRPVRRRDRPPGTTYMGRRAAPPRRYPRPAPDRPDPEHPTPAQSLQTAKLGSWSFPSSSVPPCSCSPRLRVCLYGPSSGPGTRVYGVVDYPISPCSRNLPGVPGALTRSKAGDRPFTRLDRTQPTFATHPSIIACCDRSERILISSEPGPHRGKLHAGAMRWRHRSK